MNWLMKLFTRPQIIFVDAEAVNAETVQRKINAGYVVIGVQCSPGKSVEDFVLFMPPKC
jgi:hypothetical protein